MAHSIGHEILDPARYLAIAVIGQAVEDRRNGKDRVFISDWWTEWADVPPQWITDEGVGLLEGAA